MRLTVLVENQASFALRGEWGLSVFINPAPVRLQETIVFLKKINPGQLHPCHCIDLQSKMALRQVSPVKEVYCGLELNYEE
jgi:metal-dependent hydrolase (beta-lactamase superfamily II)